MCEKLEGRDFHYFGMGILFYLILGFLSRILPLPAIFSRVSLGYIVFGIYCIWYGSYAMIVSFISTITISSICGEYFPIIELVVQSYIAMISGCMNQIILRKRYVGHTGKTLLLIGNMIICCFVGFGIVGNLLYAIDQHVLLWMAFRLTFVPMILATFLIVVGVYIGYKQRNEWFYYND